MTQVDDLSHKLLHSAVIPADHCQNDPVVDHEGVTLWDYPPHQADGGRS